tara:strand:+ start:7818 stop:8711 length:894 start_codon:yes stop_codon:yes gene_type:complete
MSHNKNFVSENLTFSDVVARSPALSKRYFLYRIWPEFRLAFNEIIVKKREEIQFQKTIILINHYLALPPYVKLQILQELEHVNFGFHLALLCKHDSSIRTNDLAVYWNNRCKINFNFEKDIDRIAFDNRGATLCRIFVFKFLKPKIVLERRKVLQRELARVGLKLRSSSKLCRKWIDIGDFPSSKHTPNIIIDLSYVVRTMVECHWCINYHDLHGKVAHLLHNETECHCGDNQCTRLFGFYKTKYTNFFAMVKKEILKEHPVPQKLPWITLERPVLGRWDRIVNGKIVRQEMWGLYL